MQGELYVLIMAAMAVAFLHTVMGPDHYLPFVALSRSRGWSYRRTVFWTLVCGCGHVWSSVLLALGGAAIGWSLSTVKWLEHVRGGLAGWAMLGFGLVYGCWGIYRGWKGRVHKHFDMHEDGSVYVYEHRHGTLIRPGDRHVVTPWVLFIVFVLGPCEPMIPLLYMPAVRHSVTGMVVLTGVYTLCTLVAMVGMVGAALIGVSFMKTEKLERYMHALGGMTLLICGAGMVFFDW